jgi:hypothetical protein
MRVHALGGVGVEVGDVEVVDEEVAKNQPKLLLRWIDTTGSSYSDRIGNSVGNNVGDSGSGHANRT